MFNLCYGASIKSTSNGNLLNSFGNFNCEPITRQPVILPEQNQDSYDSYNLYKLGNEYQKELKKDIDLIEKYLNDNNMNHQYFVNNIYEFILFEMWNIQGLSLENIKEQINDYLINQNYNQEHIIQLFNDINTSNTITNINKENKENRKNLENLEKINKKVIEKLANEIYHFIVFKYKHLTKLKNQEIEINNLESKIKELESIIKLQKKEIQDVNQLTKSNSILQKEIEELKWILNEIMETDTDTTNTNKKLDLVFQYTKSINSPSSPKEEFNEELETDKIDLLISSNKN